MDTQYSNNHRNMKITLLEHAAKTLWLKYSNRAYTILATSLSIPSSISSGSKWKEGSCPGTPHDRLTLIVAMLLATVLATAVTSSSVLPLSTNVCHPSLSLLPLTLCTSIVPHNLLLPESFCC